VSIASSYVPPTFAVPQTRTGAVTPTAAQLYPPAPLFDFVRGDFVRDGAGRIMRADGWTAWAQRSIKTILTRKRTSPLYSPEFGTSLDLDVLHRGRVARENAVHLDVRATLRRDPATLDVDQFTFTYTNGGRTAALSCRLTPTLGLPTTINVPNIFTQF
jgi:hypothetical protein